jgi:L-2,4-diaminobutyrate decarboxylase
MNRATPWVTWVTAMWNARLNQNLLHPETGAMARIIEERLVVALARFWGMTGVT